MKYQQKIHELHNILEQKLSPLIKSDFVLWGLPYHTNIGDILIWQGELDFLKTLSYKCKGVCPWNAFPHSTNYPLKVKLSQDTTILLHGGGYFGDTWRNGWEYVLDGIKQYPNNPIIMLPQTIYYKDENLLLKDIAILKTLNNLTICVRDKVSYNYALKHFGDFANILLVPDMAFFVSLDKLNKWIQPTTKQSLLLKRLDKEAIVLPSNIFDKHVDVRDWPTLEKEFKSSKFDFYQYVFIMRARFVKYFPLISALTTPIADFISKNFFRKDILKIGVSFLSRYENIYTTRLHVMILGVLLGKNVVSYDNSYGKLSSFYDTWFSDLDNVIKSDIEDIH